MIRFDFPYKDQPNAVKFPYRENISFPVYINDLLFEWTLTPHGITMYLINEKIDTRVPVIQQTVLLPDGVEIFISTGVPTVNKSIFINFKQLGLNMKFLNDLDDYILGDIDPITLGMISTQAASWIGLSNSNIAPISMLHNEADNVNMQIRTDSVLSPSRTVYTGNINNTFGLVGINKIRNMTLGEIDPHILGDIDLMLTIFRAFDNVPAYLIKSLVIHYDSILEYGIVAPHIDKNTSANNSNMELDVSNLLLIFKYTSMANNIIMKMNVSNVESNIEKFISIDMNVNLSSQLSLLDVKKDIIPNSDLLTLYGNMPSTLVDRSIATENMKSVIQCGTVSLLTDIQE